MNGSSQPCFYPLAQYISHPENGFYREVVFHKAFHNIKLKNMIYFRDFYAFPLHFEDIWVLFSKWKKCIIFVWRRKKQVSAR